MITIIIPYFNQPVMYQKQIECLSWCPFSVIFVDDFSDEPIKKAGGHSFLRITEDMGINWQGAKNLGALMAVTPWILLTDIDHTIPPETIKGLQELELNPDKVYKFKRTMNGKEILPHPNSFLITRHTFLSMGGYDLRFQGTKGGEVQFTSQLEFETLPLYLETYGSDTIKDAMTPRDDDNARRKLYAEYKKMPVRPIINFKFEML